MITIQQALKIYNEKKPSLQVNSVLDVGDEWVFSARDKETGLEIDSSPIAINKETGMLRVFFPPMNKQKLVNAKEISIEGI